MPLKWPLNFHVKIGSGYQISIKYRLKMSLSSCMVFCQTYWHEIKYMQWFKYVQLMIPKISVNSENYQFLKIYKKNNRISKMSSVWCF